MEAACRAAYEADILFEVMAEAKRHCTSFYGSSQMQRGCQKHVETLVRENGAFIIAFVEWFWFIVATCAMLLVAMFFRTRTLRKLKSFVSLVKHLLYAFVLLLASAKGVAVKLVSGGVVLRSDYVAVMEAMENRLAEQEKQLEDCKTALKRSNDALESTNRSFAELDHLIVQLKQENKHFKNLFNAEKQKNRRRSN